jgi:Lrp/AsnC family transcriptional regulator, regulator for asnA, asnC and gidA
MIDEKDYLILQELGINADQTTKQLAEKLLIPQSTVHNRIHKLRALGIIKKYVAEVNYKKLGKPIAAYILLSMDFDLHDKILEKLNKIPLVSEINVVTGSTDVIVKVWVKDAEELGELVINEMSSIGIRHTETLLVLKECK